ncbi:GHKL domain-containing protein [Enterococcus faecium]|uniref:GHKL domain-containing protein n=1 Tax=Enterococcus faecium TaxID=1352 RepID=UPI000FD69256|nr:GHKL domain-containing protein [Enterococcus faecium]
MNLDLNAFFFAILIFINIIIFHLWIKKYIKISDNFWSLIPYAILLLIFMATHFSFFFLSFLISLFSIYNFYKSNFNFGVAWLIVLFVITLISISFFLSVDINKYFCLGINKEILFLLELIIYGSLLTLVTIADKRYHFIKYIITSKKINYKLVSIYTISYFLFLITEQYFFSNKPVITFFYVTFLLLVFSILLLLFMFYIVYMEYKLEELVSYSKIAIQKEEYYSELDGFRHDFKALLFSLYVTIEEKDIIGTKKILDNISKYSNSIVDDGNLPLLNIIDPSIRGVVKKLRNIGEEKGISLKLIIPEPVKFKDINIFDLIRLISIIVNNAIEESEKTKNPIQLSIVNKGSEHIKITCKNIVNNRKEFNINKLLKKKYTTKDGHQGLGLANFSRITKRYTNLSYKFELNSESNSFIVFMDIFTLTNE